MEDSKIIELFFERSEQAIIELSNKYGFICVKVADNILNNRQDSEECVNDAYLSVWNSVPPTRPDNLFAYLCETVRRISLTKYRYNTAQKRRGNTVSIDDELSEVAADTRDDTGGLSDVLNVFLAQLPEDSRFIFMRRYYYADDVGTISKMTGLGKNAISARLSRMRKRLAEILKERGYKYEV